MILNIRGTSGSGKSTLVRLLMKDLDRLENIMGIPASKPEDASPRILGYRGHLGPLATVSVVGSYENECGGCDTIKTQDEVCDRVRSFARKGHVVFEGVIVGDIYSRYRDLAESFKNVVRGHQMKFLYLDTPLEVCLDRVRERRFRKGNYKPIDTTNSVQKWHNCRRQFARAEADGLAPVWIPWQDPLPALLESFK